MPIKLTPDQVKKLGPRPFGKKHAVGITIEIMEPDENFHISRVEFSWKKKTPAVFTNKISKATGKKFKIFNTADKLGWIVTRLS